MYATYIMDDYVESILSATGDKLTIAQEIA